MNNTIETIEKVVYWQLYAEYPSELVAFLWMLEDQGAISVIDAALMLKKYLNWKGKPILILGFEKNKVTFWRIDKRRKYENRNRNRVL